MIQSLDDVALIPTSVRSVTVTRNGEVWKTREELQAKLFVDLQGKPVTLVSTNVLGDPLSREVVFESAMIGPRPAWMTGALMDVPGGWSPWRLLLSLREKGKYFTHDRDFPVEPVILLRGAHALDFSEITRLPIRADSGMRWHCGSFAGVWTVVSSYCERYAEVLLDTSAAAIRYQQARWPERAS